MDSFQSSFQIGWTRIINSQTIQEYNCEEKNKNQLETDSHDSDNCMAY